MAITHFLAMTEAEMAAARTIPQFPAWMACHFSPYSTGLVNLPGSLPDGSLLILNDRTPIHGHDPKRVAEELLPILEQNKCAGLLMDFQNPKTVEYEVLAQALANTLPFPIGITQSYCIENAAAFLPPAPVDVPLRQYLTRWEGKKIWLETALDSMTIMLTRCGSKICHEKHPESPLCHQDTSLHCHYNVKLESDQAEFHIWRTAEDLAALLADAEGCGVELAVGLYQELAT